MNRRLNLPWLWLFVGSLCLPGLAEGDDDQPRLIVDVVASATSVAPGGTVDLLLRQKIAPGWHTYWVNPGDSGAPPDIAFDLPEGVTVSEFSYPWPERIAYGPLMNFGYKDEVLLPFTLTLAEDYPEDELLLQGSGQVLVCADVCIPETVYLDLKLPVGESLAAPSTQRLFEQARQKLPTPLEVAAHYSLVGDQLIAQVALPVPDNHRVQEVAWFPFQPDLINSAAPQTFSLSSSGLALTLMPGYDFALGADLSGVLVIYEAVGEGLVAAYELALPMKQDGATVNIAMPEEGIGFMGGMGTASLGQMGLLLAMAFAFLGGLILNLMPCVFPVLSIKILSLLESASLADIRKHGWVYTAGVVASFLAIAAALIALKLSGESVGWGFQLQSPLIVAGLAYLFVAIGLNLLGLFEIGTSIMAIGSSGVRVHRGSLKSSFGTGVLATTVAAPCTAPFMGAAIGYALTQPLFFSLAVFASLGLGMAAPYLGLCYWPGFIKRLPRPGAWMLTLRQLLAFPMFASAIWLVWVLSFQAGTNAVMQLLAGALVLSLALWVWARRPAGLLLRFTKVVFALGLLGAALYPVAKLADQGQARPSVASPARAEDPALVYSQEALAQARQKGAVLVNFTAAWCITCKVNELNALSSADFYAALDKHQVTYLKADWTNEDPEITKSLEAFGRSGVPLYLYYAPGSDQAKILPQILTKSIVLRVLAGGEA